MQRAKPLDLTLPISKTLPAFPGSPPPQFIEYSDIEQDGYNLELFFASTHTGTHMDAPYHFAKNGKKINQIPLEQLIGNATLIRLDNKTTMSNYAITKDDIRSFEREQKCDISQYQIVVFYTGWQKTHLTKNDYFTQNPGLGKSAANYLVSKNIRVIGIDSPSIDIGCDLKFSAHHILSKAGIPIVENLANLQKIRSIEFEFMALPLNLKGASGSPVRALVIDNGKNVKMSDSATTNHE